MEEEVAVVVEELGVEVVHHEDGLADLALLHGRLDPDAPVHLVQVGGRLHIGLLVELLRGLLEALLKKKKINNEQKKISITQRKLELKKNKTY